MSKIEKALNKAKSTGALRVISSPARSPRGDESLPVAATGAELEQRPIFSGMISRMRETAPLDRQVLARKKIIYPEMTENSTVRAFRELRTKILQKSQGRNCIIMVTSVVGGGGGSFVALNMGTAFAFDSSKTALLIDCNFRNPFLHNFLPAPVHYGLTDYLESPTMDVSGIIRPVGVTRLRVIPSGGKREIPGEYFTSLKMKQLLDAIKQRYAERYVILDVPPMTETADTRILAELCDYVVLVVPYGKVTGSQIEACVKAIGDKKMLGVVFNDEPVLPDCGWRDVLGFSFASLFRKIFSSRKKDILPAK